MGIVSKRYYAEIFELIPETRWFHRVILRRRGQRAILHAGPLENFTIDRAVSQITNATFVFRDPSLDLLRHHVYEPISVTEIDLSAAPA